jgi:hypothetical protein
VIVTFYSFKGGVGRSMSMMNVAEILADAGYQVIVCDFDLEAPGLERYASDDPAVVSRLRAGHGIIDLLEEYRETLAGAGPVQAGKDELIPALEGFRDIDGLLVRRPSSYAVPVPSPNGDRLGQIRFLGAGRRDGKWADQYSERVQRFDWSDFYRRWAGAEYVDFLREDLAADQAIVLVDSRTGVTEYAGICTHHLADLVVVLSAPNDLNIEGAKWMVDSITSADLTSLRGNRPLQVMPVASRVETASQVEELAAFRERFEHEFADSVPPAAGDGREFIRKTEIPYIPYYAFTEKVVARRNGSTHRELHSAYDSLARAVVSVGLDSGMLAPPLLLDWLGTLAEPRDADGALPGEDPATVAVEASRGVQIGDHGMQINYFYGYPGDRRPPPVLTDSPFQGLRSFSEQDAAFFFGRERAAQEVLQQMSHLVERPGMLMLSGTSGAGKSSLLRAGVLPRMRANGLEGAPDAASWPAVVLTPTRAPLSELAVGTAMLAGAEATAVLATLTRDPAAFALLARQAALAQAEKAGTPGNPTADRGQQRLLLLIDQFEQLFTQCDSESERRAFITALHAAATVRQGPRQAPAALVVLVVRADFEARCADYAELADTVQGRYLLTPMTELQTRLAITGPARVVGSRVDDDLVSTLLDEVRAANSAGGSLPLLSYALDQAWRSREGDALTLADYEGTGGIESAVATTAERAYASLTPAQQETARQVFLQLSTPGDGGLDTSRPASWAELTEGKPAAEADAVQAVLDAYASQRLLTITADGAEISHEVLLTAWPRLRDGWLAESRGDRIILARLREHSAEWTGHGRDRAYLYRGSQLNAAETAVQRTGAEPARYLPLSQAEAEFLLASRAAARRDARVIRSAVSLIAVLILIIILIPLLVTV